ncbi:MAG: Ig-like domain-containing protein, partial [Anaerolineae bacterium]
MRYRWVGIGITALLSAIFAATSLSSAAGTSDQPSTWQMVGQIGGPTQAMAVQGNYAYVGVGLRLVVLDVTDPVTPTEVGATVPFPYFVEDVVVSGTLAYVAAGGAGLRVVDVSDPAHPVELGTWDSPGYAEGVAAAGNSVYLADGPYGLWVVDVSDPAHPTPVGFAYDMNYAFAVAVSGNHAYVAAAGAGLLVADVSDPAHPVEVGALDTPGYAYGVAVAGATAYVADAWGGLYVVDVSDPAVPSLLGTCTMPGWALDVALAGDTAYVAAGSSGLRLVDVSDPAQPQEIGALEEGTLARRVAVRGETVYLADLTDGLLQIDVTDAQQPGEISRYSPFAEARYVAVAGSYAYVAAGFSGLRVVDVSDPARLREVAAYDTEGAYATGVVISGTVAYIPTYLSGVSPHDLHIVDISDPLHPTMLSTVDTDGVFREVAVQGQYLYAADEWGLRVIDVADPSAPEEIGFALIGGEQDQASDGVTVDGGWAYVAVAEWGMYIFDITTPSEPRLAAIFDPPGGVTSIAVSAGVAYLSNCFEGLRVVDVSDPSAPVEMGYVDTPGYSMAVALSGNRAYVSDGGGGVQVVDISDPASPVLVDSYDTEGFAWHAAVTDGHLYVADSHGGLVILEPVSGRAATSRSPLPFPPAATDRSTSAARPAAISRRASSTLLADCVVTSAADSGPGTLRWCIDNALGGDTITFDPLVFDPLNPVTITLLSSLPPLTQGSVTIDASEAGVILDGSGTSAGSSGLVIESDHNVIKGLQVIGFPATGISISGGATFNQIGGSRSLGSGPLGQGNLLSGNGDTGLSIDGTGAMSNTVLGNLIGTDAGGTELVGNGNGVMIGGGASHNTVGSGDLDEANIIAGNSDNDIALWGTGTSHNVLTGNLIGTDPSGTSMLGPCPMPGAWTTGIHLHSGASQNVIGPGNVINATLNAGVQLFGDGTDQNVVTGNLIGTDISGSQPLGNLGHGIVFNSGPQGNIVGPGNQIAYNSWSGVVVQGGTTLYNTITVNAIHDNGGQGIELTEGGNGALPAPVLTSASPTVIAGTAPAGATVEVFSGRDDEGQTYEGSTTADVSGTFTFTQPAGLTGPLITATATDAAGNTSAFSAPYILYSSTLTVTSPLDSGPGTLRQALLDASGGDIITFDPGLFDPQNPLTITLLTDLPPLYQGQVTIDGSEAGVILDGQLIADSFCGLWIASDSNTVSGLQFVGFSQTALCVDNKYNTIGGDRDQGTAPTGQGNQFGNNNEGISLWGDKNLVLGNLIGTDVTGCHARPNVVGIGVVGAGNHIGGPTPGERNIISANTFRGIQILGERARFNVVAGNYIGTDITGQYALGNHQFGVIMEVQASDNVIGGTTPAERNLISGNVDKGIGISDPGSTHNTVIGNW